MNEQTTRITTLKILLERASSEMQQPSVDKNSRQFYLRNSANMKKNLTVADNIPDEDIYVNLLQTIKNLNDSRENVRSQIEKTSDADSSSAMTQNSAVKRQNPEEALIESISPSVHKFLTEVRYFESIGARTTQNNEISNLHVKESSEKKTADTEFDQPILPTPHSSKSPMEGAVNLNDSQLPTTKLLTYKDIKYGKINLYGSDTGPRIYDVKGNIISKPIITKNLPEAFRAQPVHGRAISKDGLSEFYEQKIRDYIGYGITDDEFKSLEEYFNPEYLESGLECVTPYNFPSQGSVAADLKTTPKENGPGQHLCVVKKLKLRLQKDTQNHYPRKLKYRGLRMLPLSMWDESYIKDMLESSTRLTADGLDNVLEPGQDIIYRARIYRPHSYGGKDHKTTRHSVFNNDLVILGRQRLTALRDRLSCANDMGTRVDMSDDIECFPTDSAKQMFPSGFLFINNVFYVDKRPGCMDMSAVIRDWARRRNLGDFPVRDMGAVRLDELVLRLGHPEVYMHQGKCEHLFTFSEVRLLSPSDPQYLSYYPCYTNISQNQSVYCTTCAEFGAKWIVIGCNRVPFDPAFFCDTCFRFYLYDENGKKLGDFKAYAYKGNTVNFMRPMIGFTNTEDCASENGDGSDQ